MEREMRYMMNDNKRTLPATSCDHHVCREIFDAIESISYGEVVITIHDKKVVQIEKREKKRFSK